MHGLGHGVLGSIVSQCMRQRRDAFLQRGEARRDGVENAGVVGVADGHERRRVVGELTLVPQRGGQDDRLGDLERGLGLDVDAERVLLEVHVVAAAQLAVGEHAVLGEQLLDRLGLHLGERVDRGAQIGQATCGGLGLPLLGIAVAVEDDRTVGGDDLLEHLLHGDVEVGAGHSHRRLEGGRDEVDRVGEDRVDGDHRAGDRLAGARGPELEAVTGECEGARAVAVARIGGQGGQRVDTDDEGALLLRRRGAALGDLIEDVGQLLAEED